MIRHFGHARSLSGGKMEFRTTLEPIIRLHISAILLIALAGCGFEEDLSPINWPTYPVGAEIGEVGATPLPYPSPTSPFLNPGAPVPFQGIDSLNCAEPQGGDNRFGYCVIPGTQDVYVWGECEGECPNGPYPGVEILRVPFAESAVFMAVIEGRETATAERQQGIFRGGLLGGIGATLGIRGAAVICAGTGGWGCAFAVGVVLVDFVLAADEYRQGRDADDALTGPRGLEFSAEDQFRQLRETAEPAPELLP